MNNLEIVKATLQKYDIKFHELIENDYVYIMPFRSGDKEGFINVVDYGLIPLTKSSQFSDFMEFYQGNIASF